MSWAPIGKRVAHRIRRRPGLVRAGAVAAFFGAEMLGIAEIDQGIEVFHGLENDIAAFAAIAAIRATELDELLAAERDDAIPAIAGFEIDFRLIKKFHGALNEKRPGSARPLSTR